MRVSALQRALNDIFHSESHNVPNISIDQVRNEFMRYDGDRTGVVESSVFRRVIRDRLGWKISERAYKRLVNRLDTSRNRVDYTEFQAALAMSALALNLHTKTQTTKVKTPTTTPHYSSVSKSKKRRLTPTQRITRMKRILREMLHAQHVRTTDVSMRQVRDAFVSMDVRKRGFVTKPQFERALRFNLKWNNISSRTLDSLYDLIEDEDEEHVDYTIFQASLAMLTRQSVTPISTTTTTTTTTTNTRPAVADLASASKAVRSVLYHSVTHRYTTQSIINTGTGTEERKQSLGCDCENCSNSNCESCVEC